VFSFNLDKFLHIFKVVFFYLSDTFWRFADLTIRLSWSVWESWNASVNTRSAARQKCSTVLAWWTS